MQGAERGEGQRRIMRSDLIEQISSALAQFSSASRLYALTVGDGSGALGSGGLLV